MRMQVDLWLLIEQPLLKGLTMNKFKKMSCRLLIAFGFVAGATGAMAQSSATASANATANVIRPITLTKNVDLAFGNVVPAAGAGTMVLPATSGTPTATFTSGVTQPGTTQHGTVTAAKFTAGGEGSFTYSITLPASAATLVGPALSVDMTVDTWTVSTAGTLSGTAGTGGTEIFYVGGTLNVGAAQAPGGYTGTFSVTVAYN
jgi:hypothetical protein